MSTGQDKLELGMDPLNRGVEIAPVVGILPQRVRGRKSGIEQDWNSYGQNWTISDGKIVRVEFFPTRAEALEAAGLSE